MRGREPRRRSWPARARCSTRPAACSRSACWRSRPCAAGGSTCGGAAFALMAAAWLVTAVLVPRLLAGGAPRVMNAAEARAFPEFGPHGTLPFFVDSLARYLSQNRSGFDLRLAGEHPRRRRARAAGGEMARTPPAGARGAGDAGRVTALFALAQLCCSSSTSPTATRIRSSRSSRSRSAVLLRPLCRRAGAAASAARRPAAVAALAVFAFAALTVFPLGAVTWIVAALAAAGRRSPSPLWRAAVARTPERRARRRYRRPAARADPGGSRTGGARQTLPAVAGDRLPRQPAEGRRDRRRPAGPDVRAGERQAGRRDLRTARALLRGAAFRDGAPGCSRICGPLRHVAGRDHRAEHALRRDTPVDPPRRRGPRRPLAARASSRTAATSTTCCAKASPRRFAFRRRAGGGGTAGPRSTTSPACNERATRDHPVAGHGLATVVNDAASRIRRDAPDQRGRARVRRRGLPGRLPAVDRTPERARPRGDRGRRRLDRREPCDRRAVRRARPPLPRARATQPRARERAQRRRRASPAASSSRSSTATTSWPTTRTSGCSASLDRTGSDLATGNVQRLTRQGTSQAQFLARTFARSRERTHVTADALAPGRPHGLEQAVPARVLGRARVPLPRRRGPRGHPGDAARAPRGRPRRRARGARLPVAAARGRRALRSPSGGSSGRCCGDRLDAVERGHGALPRPRDRHALALVRPAASSPTTCGCTSTCSTRPTTPTARCSSRASTRCSTALRRASSRRCPRSTGSSGGWSGSACTAGLVGAPAGPRRPAPPRPPCGAAGATAPPTPRPASVPASAFRLGRRDEDLALTATLDGLRHDAGTGAAARPCLRGPRSGRPTRRAQGARDRRAPARRAARGAAAARRAGVCRPPRCAGGDLGPARAWAGFEARLDPAALCGRPLGRPLASAAARAGGSCGAAADASRWPRPALIGALDLGTEDGPGDPAAARHRRGRAARPRGTSSWARLGSRRAARRRARAGGRLGAARRPARELRAAAPERRAGARLIPPRSRTARSARGGCRWPRCAGRPPSLEAIATGTAGRPRALGRRAGRAGAATAGGRSAASSGPAAATTSRSPARGSGDATLALARRRGPRRRRRPARRRRRSRAALSAARPPPGAAASSCARARPRARPPAPRPRRRRWRRARPGERVEDLPLAPLAPRARRCAEVGVRPVAELVGVEVLELDAAPVGQRERRRVGRPQRQLPVDRLGEAVAGPFGQPHGSQLRSGVSRNARRSSAT